MTVTVVVLYGSCFRRGARDEDLFVGYALRVRIASECNFPSTSCYKAKDTTATDADAAEVDLA